MSKKITYILSNIDKAIAFEWIVTGINKDLFELDFIFLNASEPFLYKWLKGNNIQANYVQHKSKRDYLRSISKVRKLLKKSNPDIVHCHLLDANLIGLIAAKSLGIKRRIYTRHHSTYHHDYHPSAIKYDRLCNRLATDVVAISENVKKVLIERENCRPSKVHLIHHGFDLEKFKAENIAENLNSKYGVTIGDYPVIGVISRYMKLKGVKYSIRAFGQLLKKHPSAKLILANAYGSDGSEIEKELADLPKNSFVEIKFEANLFALYQLFDVFIHTPINAHVEAFGQTYVESLAAGIPSVFTLSGVANEFVENGKNAVVVSYGDSKAILAGVNKILDDSQFRKSIVEKGLESVKTFRLNKFIENLEELYTI